MPRIVPQRGAKSTNGISQEDYALKNRTSQEEGLAPARANPSSSGGKPLFLTCSILQGLILF